MSEQNPDKEQMAAIIHQSGCSEIQEAIAVIEEAGFSVADLPNETLESVIGVMASAEEVGAEAGRVAK